MSMNFMRFGAAAAAVLFSGAAFAQGGTPPASGAQRQPQQQQQQPQQPQGPVKADLVPVQPDWTKICGNDPQTQKEVCYTTRDFGLQADQPILAIAVYDPKDVPEKIVRLLLPPGLLLTLLVLWLMREARFDYLVSLNAFLAWAQPGRLMMTIGYAALLVLLIKHHAASPWIGRVAAAGRAAFSNYLGTSIVMTTIFYGYGLGLFGRVDRAPLYLFVIAAWAVMLLWSKPWLDRFRYGPLEWLWRSLARGAMQPMRKEARPQ